MLGNVHNAYSGLVGVVTLVMMISLAACSVIPSSEREIVIDSVPQGVDVIADGKNIGVTPVTVKPHQLFEARWKGTSYRAVGTLDFQHSGCASKSIEIDDAVISKDILVQLECSADIPKTVIKPKSQVVVESVEQSHTETLSSSIERRLNELEQLRSKNLINDEEYSTIRARILKDL